MVKNESVREYLLIQHDVLGRTWTDIAKEHKVSPAMVWRVANQGYEPKDDVIREKLGFPQVIKQTVYRDEHGRFRKAGE